MEWNTRRNDVYSHLFFGIAFSDGILSREQGTPITKAIATKKTTTTTRKLYSKLYTINISSMKSIKHVKVRRKKRLAKLAKFQKWKQLVAFAYYIGCLHKHTAQSFNRKFQANSIEIHRKQSFVIYGKVGWVCVFSAKPSLEIIDQIAFYHRNIIIIDIDLFTICYRGCCCCCCCCR